MAANGAAGFDIAAQARRVVYFIAAKKQIIRCFLQVKSQSPIAQLEIALAGHPHAIIAAGILGQIILRAVHIAGQGIAPIGGEVTPFATDKRLLLFTEARRHGQVIMGRQIEKIGHLNGCAEITRTGKAGA